MSKKTIPEHLLTEKQKQDKKYRQNNQKYTKKYSRYYYLQKLLEDPNYNKKRWLRAKELKKTLLEN